MIIHFHIWSESGIILEYDDDWSNMEIEQIQEEFILNWCSQVPHWRYFTDRGINKLKDTKGIKYKRPEDYDGYKM